VIRRIGAAVLLILGLTVSALAAPDAPYTGTLAERMDAFRQAHRLTEENFAVSYRDLTSGETYDFNETGMMTAASTFKLPLNLYYYEMEQSGDISPDAYLADAGTTLRNCHRMSLVDSNNEVSIAMLYHLGSFRTYKDKMRKYFTMTDEEISTLYWADNYYCTRMMADALEYLYQRQDDFPEMIEYLKQAQPHAYFKKYVDDREIAHKYGSFEGAENDVGIFFGDHPFLLAVYTQSAGEDISAQAAVLFRDYTDQQAAAREAEAAARLAEEEAARQAERERLAAEEAAKRAEKDARDLEAASEAAGEETENAPSGPVLTWWMILVMLGVFASGSGIVLILTHHVRKRHTADSAP